MPNDNEKVIRKLRAILSADVKGYSLLMADDEVHTIQTLKAYRQIMSDFIKQHSGRVVDNPGDNLLAEFGSAVDAVGCAVQIQNSLKKENAKFVEEKRLQFRIGVNIGDIVQDGDRIYGSGVNVAARIEGIADPGGICISRNTYDQVKSKLCLDFEYLGEHEVKNIKEPVRGYKILLDTGQPKPLEEKLELPDKPSIAVLPFNNMSGDPEQEYFSDGITEDIITALSRSSMLFVISRNSSFTYRGSAIDVRKVSRELGVRFVVEGSVRKAGNRIRVTAQLIDGTTGKHIWAEKYDGELQDIFDLQDTITQQVAATIQPQIYLYEGEKNIRVDRTDIATWELIARAWKLSDESTKESIISAEKLLRKTIAYAPKSCEAYLMLACVIIMQIVLRYSSNPTADAKEALSFARRAVSLNSNNEYAHVYLGIAQYLLDKRDLAISELRRAIEINPNNATAYAALGNVLCTKNPDESIECNKKALRINPRDPTNYFQYSALAWAYFMKGKYSEAINWIKKAIQMNPYYRPPHTYLITSLVKLNKLEEAKAAWEYYLEYYPDETISKIKNYFSWDKRGVDHIFQALSKIGVPD
jgi:adenylate cyclase